MWEGKAHSPNPTTQGGDSTEEAMTDLPVYGQLMGSKDPWLVSSSVLP